MTDAAMMRTLGRSGIKVSALGLGCFTISGPWWRDDKYGNSPYSWGDIDDTVSTKAIHKALDLGVNFFDMADSWGGGHGERVVGQAVAGRRDQVVLSTKAGNVFYDRVSTGTVCGTPDYVRRRCEESLKRLNTDYIDLYNFHLNKFEPEQAGVLRELMEDLVKEGKIRYYGWSTDYRHRVQVFAPGAHFTAAEFQMNVIDDAAEMVMTCDELNIAGIIRTPLAMGLLTGKYTSDSILAGDDIRGKNSPYWVKYFDRGKTSPIWLAKVEAVGEILRSNGRSTVQGALAWLWARSGAAIPIPGFRTPEQVEENCLAMQHGPLTADQMNEIEKVLGR